MTTQTRLSSEFCLSSLQLSCLLAQQPQSGGWPVAPMPGEFRTVQPTTVDTLLVSGTIDYSTPAQVATEELLPFLPNGEHVILSEFGHFNDVWGFQPEATRHLLATFFDTGEADDSLFTYEPMPPLDVKLQIVTAIVMAPLAGIAVGISTKGMLSYRAQSS